MWWYMLVILALVRLGQQDPCKFKTILGYEVSSSQPDLHSKTLSQNDDEKKKKKNTTQNHKTSCTDVQALRCDSGACV